jgi:DNA-binding transcriptional LysR family regulator
MANITLKQLRAFAAIARHTSFTQAAAELRVSQSALTIAIRDLEREVGARLFDRTTRSVELTPHAAGFLAVAARMLGDLDRALEDMRAVAERRKGSVVVAAAASFIEHVATPALARLAHQYPGISVRLEEEHTEGVTRRVLSGEADFGVTTLWRVTDGLDAELLLRDQVGVLHPRQHPLAEQSSRLTWKNLTSYPVVGLNRGAGVRELVDHNKAIAVLLRPTSYEVSSLFMLNALIVRGVGIAVLPAFAAKTVATGSLVFRPVYQPAIFRELFVVRRRGRKLTPAARQIAQFVVEELSHHAADSNIEIAAPLASLRLLAD